MYVNMWCMCVCMCVCVCVRVCVVYREQCAVGECHVERSYINSSTNVHNAQCTHYCTRLQVHLYMFTCAFLYRQCIHVLTSPPSMASQHIEYLSDGLGADIHNGAKQNEHQLGYVKVHVTDQRWELIQHSFVLSRLDVGG